LSILTDDSNTNFVHFLHELSIMHLDVVHGVSPDLSMN
jgi:hypothetical protein